jgi:DNA-binding response OmpR family regulator
MQNGSAAQEHGSEGMDAKNVVQSAGRANFPRRVLLAEDDEQMRRLLASALRRDGYEVVEASDGIECMKHMAPPSEEGASPVADLIISDIRMPGRSGLEILRLTRARNLDVPVILITAFGAAETHAEGQRLGAAAVFDKPFDLDDLRAMVLELVPPT